MRQEYGCFTLQDEEPCVVIECVNGKISGYGAPYDCPRCNWQTKVVEAPPIGIEEHHENIASGLYILSMPISDNVLDYPRPLMTALPIPRMVYFPKHITAN